MGIQTLKKSWFKRRSPNLGRGKKGKAQLHGVERLESRELMAADYFDHFGDIHAANDVLLQSNYVQLDGDRNAARFDAWQCHLPTERPRLNHTALIPPGASSGDWAGYAVSVDSGVAVVAAVYDDYEGMADSGAAYVFRRIGKEWRFEQTLVPNDLARNDQFGQSVAIRGNMIVISSRLDDDGGSNSGSAYVFQRRGGRWVQHAKLRASDAARFDQFGSSVATDGKTIAVGASLADSHGLNAGAVYTFQRAGDQWIETGKLTGSDTMADDNFGVAVAVDHGFLIAGAPYHDATGTDTGAIYAYEWSSIGWRETSKLWGDDTIARDHFGTSVSVSAGAFVVGVRRGRTGARWGWQGRRSGLLIRARQGSVGPGAEDNT